MELPINQDPQKLNENKLFGGKKWWQWVCIILAAVIAVIFVFILGDKFNDTVLSLICCVVVLPLGYVGIFQRNGLDFFEFYRQKKANGLGSNTFVYVSEPITAKQVSQPPVAVKTFRRARRQITKKRR